MRYNLKNSTRAERIVHEILKELKLPFRHRWLVNGREVDFIVKKGTEVTELIQVCYEAVTSDVEQREVRALLEASDELKVKKMTVLTWDEKREIKKDGSVIQLKPLWEWLLENNL